MPLKFDFEKLKQLFRFLAAYKIGEPQSWERAPKVSRYHRTLGENNILAGQKYKKWSTLKIFFNMFNSFYMD